MTVLAWVSITKVWSQKYSFVFSLAIESTALQWLADISDGDARIALGNLQMVIQDKTGKDGKVVTVDDIKEGVKVIDEPVYYHLCYIIFSSF